MAVITDDGHEYIDRVTGIIIDHETGKAIGLFVSRNRVIPIAEVLQFNHNVLVHDIDSIAEPEEIIRVQRLIEDNVPIYRNKVFTETGEELGFVHDYAIDTKSMLLQKIYVYKQTFIFKFDPRIISARAIIEIRKDGIIVKDAAVRAYARAKAKVAPNMSPA